MTTERLNKRVSWLTVVVPAVASLVGVLVGGFITAHIENNRSRHEVRAQAVQRRADVYLEFVKSYGDVIVPDRALDPAKALRRLLDAEAAVNILGSDRASDIAGEALRVVNKYGDIKPGDVSTEAVKAMTDKESEFLVVMRYELRALGGLPPLDEPIPGWRWR